MGSHGSTFVGATELMRMIALKLTLNENRQVELNSNSLNQKYKIIHNDDRADTDVTALYWACRTGQSSTALLLLESGAPVNILSRRSDGRKTSPLFWATKYGMNRVV